VKCQGHCQGNSHASDSLKLKSELCHLKLVCLCADEFFASVSETVRVLGTKKSAYHLSEDWVKCV
jgi:hypothetical protein